MSNNLTSWLPSIWNLHKSSVTSSWAQVSSLAKNEAGSLVSYLTAIVASFIFFLFGGGINQPTPDHGWMGNRTIEKRICGGTKNKAVTLTHTLNGVGESLFPPHTFHQWFFFIFLFFFIFFLFFTFPFFFRFFFQIFFFNFPNFSFFHWFFLLFFPKLFLLILLFKYWPG
jgi:hypothetical protein